MASSCRLCKPANRQDGRQETLLRSSGNTTLQVPSKYTSDFESLKLRRYSSVKIKSTSGTAVYFQYQLHYSSSKRPSHTKNRSVHELAKKCCWECELSTFYLSNAWRICTRMRYNEIVPNTYAYTQSSVTSLGWTEYIYICRVLLTCWRYAIQRQRRYRWLGDEIKNAFRKLTTYLSSNQRACNPKQALAFLPSICFSGVQANVSYIAKEFNLHSICLLDVESYGWHFTTYFKYKFQRSFRVKFNSVVCIFMNFCSHHCY